MKALQDIKFDFTAGFSVALVALPLSIGIALASGAPASSGLIAAIIGGLIGSWLGGSQVTINGPAAGLIVIVLDAVNNLGHGASQSGFRGMLAAAVVAGALQIVFAFMKLGRKGTSFPTSVIHGMMAAIGLIIIAKQVHVLFGYKPNASNPMLLFAEIPHALMNLNPLVFLTGIISLVVLIAWSKSSFVWTKKIPAPLITIFVGAGIASYFGLSGKALLQVPTDFSQWIIFPDFSVMSSYEGWKAAITIALVASLETTLSAAAVDKLDSQKRKSNLDKDLFSKGICNMLSASIGGLPMIAEIVRSSANVSFGAKTWRSNFIHGAVVLTLVLALPAALAFIPLASLAAILLMVGSRLGNPLHILHAKKIGFDNLVGFLTTMCVTLAVDLLVGIFVGALAQFAVEMFLGLKFKNLIKPSFEIEDKENETSITINSALTFSNFLGLKDQILALQEKGKSIRLDLSQCSYIDHSVMEELHDLKDSFVFKRLKFEVVLSEKHTSLGADELSALRLA